MNSFSLIVVVIVAIITIQFAYGDQEQLEQESNYNYSDYDKGINSVIVEGLENCSYLQSDECITIMNVLNDICRAAYFPNCFGNEEWTPYMEYLKEGIEKGDISNIRPIFNN